MISVDLKENSVLLSLEGKQSKVMTEVFIALAKLTGDNPETINTTLGFLKLLDKDLKNGLDVNTIINSLMGSYYEVCEKKVNKWFILI